MKHLPFNHTWQVLEAVHHRVPMDYLALEWQTVTKLNLFCHCGKVRTVQIAPFKMTQEQINTYVEAVYG